MKGQPGEDTGPSPAEASDEHAIRKVATVILERDRAWQSLLKSRPEFQAASQFQIDLTRLASTLEWPTGTLPKRLKKNAFRILLSRFSNLEARMLISAVAEVSPSQVRISVRSRDDDEVPDGGRARRKSEREWADAKLLEAYHRYLGHGHSSADAREAAARELGVQSTGHDGLKKVLSRARKAAGARGYVDPLAPVRQVLTGLRDQPEVRREQLTKRCRPKKRKQGK